MPPRPTFRQIRVGVERMARASDLPRHRHREGYANVVLAGSFVEAGFWGVAEVTPGDVIAHAAFECHQNRTPRPHEPQPSRLYGPRAHALAGRRARGSTAFKCRPPGRADVTPHAGHHSA